MPFFSKTTTIHLLYGLLLLAAVGLITFWFLKFNERPMNTRFFMQAILVGIVAQLVDGAIGMAYGITATSFLLFSGASPATASAATHLAESFTSAASGLSHWKADNIDKKLLKALLLPGAIGAIVGVLCLVYIDGKLLRPYISAYLLLLGLYVFTRAFRPLKFSAQPNKRVAPLGFLGGFVDSIGGGGWGPVVTTTLVSGGSPPRQTIGSVSTAEFVVTLTSGFSFVLFLGIPHWEATAGLMIGGLIAAPFGAKLTAYFSQKTLLIWIGVVITLVSSYNLYVSLM